jgi:hypothetical protein
MTGDHHGRGTGRATLLVRAVDAILGTHNTDDHDALRLTLVITAAHRPRRLLAPHRADFQVSSDVAIRRHQALVNCAFSYCWDTWFADHTPQHRSTTARVRHRRRGPPATSAPPPSRPPGDPGSTRLAYPLDRIAALAGRMVQRAPPWQLQAPIDSAGAGCGLYLHILN